LETQRILNRQQVEAERIENERKIKEQEIRARQIVSTFENNAAAAIAQTRFEHERQVASSRIETAKTIELLTVERDKDVRVSHEVAATSYHFGMSTGGPAFIASAFAVIAAAFLGHVVANSVLGSDFSGCELALGLVVFGVGLVALGVATLASQDFAGRAFWPTSLGFVGLLAVFVFYLVTKSGLRSTFDAFDTIRPFRVRGGLENTRNRE
jgi:VIT1/CCC1 family predicted Fe2+/Mn2+ transporter